MQFFARSENNFYGTSDVVSSGPFWAVGSGTIVNPWRARLDTGRRKMVQKVDLRPGRQYFSPSNMVLKAKGH